MAKKLIRLGLVLFGAVSYLGLAVLGEGGFHRYSSVPARRALAVVILLATLVAFFAGGSVGGAKREDRGNRWVLAVLVILGLVDGFVPALTDRLNLGVWNGDTSRWAGVALVALGCVVRIWPVFVLGNRFSAGVAIQEGHQLETRGPYRLIRNPSYLGIIMIMVGWALTFRSLLGLAMAVLVVPFLVVRIDAEERILREEFGSAFDEYVARTKRLIPGIY